MALTNAFAARVFETEEFSSNKSFSHEFAYEDRYHSSSTVVIVANSNFSLTGAAQQVYHKYKNRADLSSGLAIFYTSVKRKEGKRGQIKYSPSDYHDYVGIVDLGTFREFFAEPRELAELFNQRAKQLIFSWNEKNASPSMVGKRVPMGVTYVLARYEWLNSKNRPEVSEVTIQLSTFGFTIANMQTQNPKLSLLDIKYIQKMKSTVAPGHGPDQTSSESGLYYDQHSYSVPWPHMAGLLRSEGFPDLLGRVAESVSALENEDESARKKIKRGELDTEGPTLEEGEIVE